MGKAFFYFLLTFMLVMGLMQGYQHITKAHVITVFKTGVAAMLAFVIAMLAFIIEVNLN